MTITTVSSGIKVGYVRVSTPDQYPERQIQDMKADKFFVDIYSGKTLDRPQFKIMMEYLRDGDTLIVHSLDRLARNLDDLRKTVMGLLNRGIKVEFITERLIFDGEASPMGLLVLSMMGAFAEFERRTLHERRAAGIALAKARGAFKGRKPKFTEEIYREIEKMNALGAEKKTIAKYLNISRTSVYNYLKLKGPAVRKKNDRI